MPLAVTKYNSLPTQSHVSLYHIVSPLCCVLGAPEWCSSQTECETASVAYIQIPHAKVTARTLHSNEAQEGTANQRLTALPLAGSARPCAVPGESRERGFRSTRSVATTTSATATAAPAQEPTITAIGAGWLRRKGGVNSGRLVTCTSRKMVAASALDSTSIIFASIASIALTDAPSR